MAEEKITKEMIIADVLEKYPITERVFKKYLGKSCSTCAGSKYEDIFFGATMHNADADMVVRELNEAIEEEAGK
jgi:hybrid cluster-associated redox disulfide protein